jgi:hypothetical protein
MTTLLNPRTPPVTPLIDMREPAFFHAYQQGMQRIRFEQQDHHGPFSASDVIEILNGLARMGLFDEEHETALYRSLGSYSGMIHGAVLTEQGTVQQGVTTLVYLDQQDFLRGYRAGRNFFFLEAESKEERALTDCAVAVWLREAMQDSAGGGDPEGLLYFCVGDLFGQLSGHLFSWTREEQQAWEQECVKELGYVCAIPKTCLVALMSMPALQAAS